jgi:hypothetical protein
MPRVLRWLALFGVVLIGTGATIVLLRARPTSSGSAAAGISLDLPGVIRDSCGDQVTSCGFIEKLVTDGTLRGKVIPHGIASCDSSFGLQGGCISAGVPRLEFDGQQTFVEVPLPVDYGTSSFSFEALINLRNENRPFARLVERPSKGRGKVFSLEVNPDNRGKLRFVVWGRRLVAHVDSKEQLQPGFWTHVVAELSGVGVARQISLYVNGEKQNHSGPLNDPYIGDSSLRVGGGNPDAPWFDGAVAHVEFSDTPKGPEEIQKRCRMFSERFPSLHCVRPDEGLRGDARALR